MYCWCAAYSWAICSFSKLTKASAAMAPDAISRRDQGGQSRQAQEALLQVAPAVQEVSRRVQAPGERGLGGKAAKRHVRAARGRHQEGPQSRPQVTPWLSCGPHGHLSSNRWQRLSGFAS